MQVVGFFRQSLSRLDLFTKGHLLPFPTFETGLLCIAFEKKIMKILSIE